MLRSLYAGVSGMKDFQIKLDVVGNNIANVNTYGYKKARVSFKDLASQMIANASAPSAAPGASLGGVNAKQVGLGATVGSIDTIMTAASLQTTGNPTDLAIDGDGFFVVQDPANAANFYYTRAGNFGLDANGNLVNPDGYKVLDTTGAPVVISSTVFQSYNISKTGIITGIAKPGQTLPNPAQQIQLVTFNNPGGLVKQGNNLYAASNSSGAANPTTPGVGAGFIASGTLEMSNVDLSEEMTEMIVGQRGFQANSRIITTSDQILEELVNLKR